MKRAARILASVGIATLLATALRAAPVEILKEGNIVVTFEKSGDEEQVKTFQKDVLPKVKVIVERVTNELGGVSGASEAKISFYSPATYNEKFPQLVKANISAFYNNREVIASIDNEITPLVENTLTHELVHNYLDQTFGRNIPAWLNEGLAVYVERKNTIDNTPVFADYNTIVVGKQKGDLIPIEKLEEHAIFHRTLGTEPSKMAYCIAYVGTFELIQKSGIDSIRKYLSALAKGGDPKKEFGVAFGIPYEKFNDFLVEVSNKKT